MMKYHLRKIVHAVSVKNRERINDRYIVLFSLFLFGLFFGCMASSTVFSENFSHLSNRGLVFDFCLVAALLFFSTSFLGCFLTPIVLVIKGFIFAAVLSSIYLSDSGGLIYALLGEAVPAILFIPCFFIIASDSALLSSRLLHFRTRHSEFQKSRIIRHILCCAPFLIFEFVYCIYLLPLFI